MPPPVSRQTKHHTFIDGGSAAYNWAQWQKPASNWTFKIREIACNLLTKFDYEAYWLTGNENFQSYCEEFVKSDNGR